MKAGVIAKPGLASLPVQAQRILSGIDELFCSREFGGSLLSQARPLDSGSEGLGYKERIAAAIRAFEDAGADLIVTIGGDGLASYAASAAILNGGKLPDFLGIPAGTANIGPIAGPLDAYSIAELEPFCLDAIEVSDGDTVIGYAFNDLVIGDTFLGTLGTRMVNFSARALALEDRLEVQDPSDDILTSDFSINMNSVKIPFGNWDDVKQICVSTLHCADIAGRAVYGGLIDSVGMDHAGALAMLDRIAVDSREENWKYKGLTRTAHICFENGDCLVLSGLSDKGQLIIDGNPFIRKSADVTIRIRPDAIRALRRKHEHR
ncbi:MAG: hypothetical protein PHO44_02715 [Sphaerochaetaceae bacterium]|nr:hypothetical protein [Sphaerochaetaceae bacterium]MDD3162804.1 hypothetical protein [Sphaerochaetaceae bacterium]MDD4006871.1 hypothetical protein [Sphaerochaetaceae bacterium]MDD4396003.1 hypothetical protein [Sphaerochaetaceae bacterium]